MMKPTIALIVANNRVPHGMTFPSYEFVEADGWGIVPNKPVNPIGHRGLVSVSLDVIDENKRADEYKSGDLVFVGAYRFRVVEYVPWADAITCAWDTPLGWVQVLASRVDYARRWFVHRCIATARIWGLVEIDMSIDSSRGITLTRILWHKINRNKVAS